MTHGAQGLAQCVWTERITRLGQLRIIQQMADPLVQAKYFLFAAGFDAFYEVCRGERFFYVIRRHQGQFGTKIIIRPHARPRRHRTEAGIEVGFQAIEQIDLEPRPL